MEPNALLALSRKLSSLYATDSAGGSFLALQFPALPLDVGGGAGLPVPDHEAAREAADLARILNLIPAPAPRFSSDMRLLWNVYDTVLRDAVVAADPPDEAERAARERARSVLYVHPAPDAPVEASARLLAYDTHRSRYTSAELALNSLLMSIAHAASPQEADRLRLQQPMLERAAQQALDDWHGMGFKREVEEAKAVLSNSDGGGNLLAWRDWRDDFQRARRTDPEDGEYYETRLFPDDPATEANWTRVSLHAGELAALTATAPTDPLADLTAGAPTFDVELLSIEVARVDIIRSWWDPMLVRSRFWRWRDPGRAALSDGLHPPTGDLPAYVTGLVLGRNLTLSLSPGSRRNDVIMQAVRADRRIQFGPMVLAVQDDQGGSALVSVAVPALRPHQLSGYLSSTAGPGAGPVFARRALQEHAAALERPMVAAPASARAARPTEGPPIIVRPLPESDRPAPPRRPWWKDGPPRGPGGVRPRVPEPAPPPLPPAAEPGLHVIGFLCAAVPRSPDPDPDLEWS